MQRTFEPNIMENCTTVAPLMELVWRVAVLNSTLQFDDPMLVDMWSVIWCGRIYPVSLTLTSQWSFDRELMPLTSPTERQHKNPSRTSSQTTLQINTFLLLATRLHPLRKATPPHHSHSLLVSQRSPMKRSQLNLLYSLNAFFR